jgi:hypothetical protein
VVPRRYPRPARVFFLQRGFEIQPGGNRFVLEDDIAKTGAFGRTFKNPLRLGVGVIAA